MDPELKALLAALGVTSAADAHAAVARFQNFLTSLQEATGAEKFADVLASVKANAKAITDLESVTEKSGAEVLGVVTAWKEQAEKAEATKTELADLRKDNEKGEVKATLDGLCEAGTLEPANREKAEAFFAEHGIAAFRAYVDTLPKGPVPAARQDGPRQPQPAAATGPLSEDAKYVARVLGKSEAATKRAHEMWKRCSNGTNVATIREEDLEDLKQAG